MINNGLKNKIDRFLGLHFINMKVTSIPEGHESGIPIAGIIMRHLFDYEVMMVEDKLTDPMVRMMVLYHEYGHAFYGHNLHALKYFNKLKKFTIQNRDYIKSVAAKLNLNEKKLNYLFTDSFIFNLLNIIGDLQINSTILDLNCINKIDSALKVDSIHPSKYNFPSGLNFDMYLLLVTQNLDRIVKDIDENDHQSMGINGLEESEINDGSGKLGSGKGFFNQDMIDELKNSGEFDEDGDLVDNNLSNSTKAKSKELSKLNGSDESNKNPTNSGNSNRSPIGNSTSFRSNTSNILQSFDDLFKSIKSSKETKVSGKRDLYKLQHRGRVKDMFVPSIKITQTSVLVEKMIFLADVSGSMKEKSIFGIINDLSIRVKRLGLKEVKLITWNTDKVQEITLDDFKTLKQGLRIGGGTELAEGIKYINSFNKDNYPVIVISDLEDNLSEWNREFLKNNSPNYVVSVGKNSRRLFSRLDKSIKIYESDYL
jgi:hypothetical protein